jgi:hypothetical protein
MIMMNKRGGEKVLSIWWFFVLAIIGAGIVVGVLMYYSTEVDVRNLEANILAERLESCLTNGLYLNQEVLSKEFNVYEKCGLNKEIFDTEGLFYFKISINYLDGKEVKEAREEPIIGGDTSFPANCDFSEKMESARYFPRCVNKINKISFIKDGVKLKGNLVILTGSNQGGRKVTLA